jgi:prepilin-type N-terminal cleavage/methylation domain-containing protein
MRKLGFTLVELLIVIILMGLVSFLVIRLPSAVSAKPKSITDLRNILYPEGKITVYSDGKIQGDKKINFDCTAPEVLIFENGEFKKKMFNKNIIFEYKVKNGIGDSFILKCEKGYYVFKPFNIKKTDTLNEAEELFTNSKYKLKEGNYY